MRAQSQPAGLAEALPVSTLRQALLAWYDRARRDLPWRAPTGVAADPWAVLVSELMLQQTTVATVRGRFAAFLARFPTPAAMADRPVEDVLHAWAGLGYYRRARALHACAVAITADHGGRPPLEPEALARLPGVGPYTAAAVAAIAGGRPVVPVDGNVERVMARLLAVATPLPAARRSLRASAQALAGDARAGDLAQALMELGAIVCTPRRPGCLACPWRPWCRAAATGAPETFPARTPRQPRPARHAVAFLLERADGAILFRRRPLDGLLGGMVELPSTPWLEAEAAAAAALPAAAPAPVPWVPVPGSVRHVLTHLELWVRLVRAKPEGVVAPESGFWSPPAGFTELALPSLTTKLLRHAGLRW